MRKTKTSETTNLGRFFELVQDIEWSTIDEIIGRLDDADFWDDGFYDQAESNAKKQAARRMMRQLRDEDDNFPLFGSLKVPTEDGGIEHVYKPIANFTVQDHQQTVDQIVQEIDYDCDLIVGHNKRCLARHGVQLSFYFKHDVKL